MAEPAAAARPARETNHSRIVLTTIGIWIAAHIGIALAFGLPSYVPCRSATSVPYPCGLDLGLVFLFVGLVQLVYGVVAGLVLMRRRPAISQGIFIGMSVVTVLFTVVCFGATASG